MIIILRSEFRQVGTYKERSAIHGKFRVSNNVPELNFIEKTTKISDRKQFTFRFQKPYNP